jgi:hypothetical protein
MRGDIAGKWGYVATCPAGRRPPDLGVPPEGHSFSIAPLPGRLDPGDLVAARVSSVGGVRHLEDRHGRHLALYPDDPFIGAWASDPVATEGDVLPAHLLTPAGLIGDRGPENDGTPLELYGVVAGPAGPVSCEGFALPVPAECPAGLGTVAVVGCGPGSGPRAVAVSLTLGFSRAALAVGAGKVLGSASGQDRWAHVDAGARAVVDFHDFGLVSTSRSPMERLERTVVSIWATLWTAKVSVVVLDFGDEIPGEAAARLIGRLGAPSPNVVLAARHALSAVGMHQTLAVAGVRVRALSGALGWDPDARLEAAGRTGIPVVDLEELADGAALDLLTAIRL